MVSLGKVLIMPRDAYSANETYTQLDLVTHNGSVWVCKQTAIGIEPTEANSSHWMKMFGLNIVNNLNYTVEGGVLDARQGNALKNLMDEKVVYESVFVTSDEIGKITIPIKDNYDVYSVLCKSDGCTLVGNEDSLYLHVLTDGNIGDLAMNEPCTLAVTYVRKGQVV